MRYSFILITLLLTGTAVAATIRVPEHVATIQGGLNTANAGDTVLVSPGHYYENIVFPGHDVLLASRHLLTGDARDIRETVIDGGNKAQLEAGSVVQITRSETSASILHGFTITGGTGTNRVTPNEAGRFGGGILISGASPVIRHNYIIGNSTGFTCNSHGGGIAVMVGAKPLIVNNIITNNIADGPCDCVCYFGGGIWIDAASQPIIGGSLPQANQIYGNRAIMGSQIYRYGSGSPVNAQYNVFTSCPPASWDVYPAGEFDTNHCQDQLQVGPYQQKYLGLAGQNLTSLSQYGGIIAVGTEGHGVWWGFPNGADTPDWRRIPLDSLNVLTVYAHKSGPIGWAISAGVQPPEDDDTFVYCSFVGQPFEKRSHGIDPAQTRAVTALDGFPDQTICGETYAVGDMAVYRKAFGDTTWHAILTTSEGNFRTVKAHEEYPGVVLVGGGTGFAGHYLGRSLDFGDTWQDISPLRFVEDVDFFGVGAKTIFAVDGNAVYRSLDGGSSWRTVFSADIPESPRMTEVLIEPYSQRVFIAGIPWPPSPALFYSADWGQTWRPITLQKNFTDAVVDIEPLYDGSILVAFRDSGVYRVMSYASLIQLSVATDKAVYTPGETVEISVTAYNQAEQAVHIQWPTSCQAGYTIDMFSSKDQGLCTTNLTGLNLLPGMSHTWTFRHTRDLHLLTEGSHTIRGELVDHDIFSAPIIINVEKPNEIEVEPVAIRWRLFQNQPNPFQQATTIRFTLSQNAVLTLRVYNIAGQLVRTLADGAYPAGEHTLVWDGVNTVGQPVGAGVYHYRLEADGRLETKRLVLLR